MAVTIHDTSDKLSWPHKPWCADQRIYWLYRQNSTVNTLVWGSLTFTQ